MEFFAPRRVVIASVLAAALAAVPAAHAATLTIKVKGGGRKGARVELRRISRGKPHRAGTKAVRRGRARFTHLRRGDYVALLHARRRVAAPRALRLGRRSGRLTIKARALKLDKGRRATGVFQPGRSFSLFLADRRRVAYLLTLPPNALAKPTTITMTAYRGGVAPGANGTGVELGPSGTKLAAPGVLTVGGGRAARSVLVTYDRRGRLVGLPTDKRGTATSFVLNHFSPYGDGVPSAEDVVGAVLAALPGAGYFVILGEAAAAAGKSVEDYVNSLPADERGVLLDAFRGYKRELAHQARKAVKAACATGADKGSFDAAMEAVDGARAFDALSLGQRVDLRQQAARTCLLKFDSAGLAYCQAAVKVQDGPGRKMAREEYLFFSRDELVDDAELPGAKEGVEGLIRGCIGYTSHGHNDYSGSGFTGSFDYNAMSCDDLVASHWTGKTVFDIQGGGGFHEEKAMDFTVPADGSRFEWAPPKRDDQNHAEYWGTADIPDSMTIHEEVRSNDDNSFVSNLVATGAIVPGVPKGACGT